MQKPVLKMLAGAALLAASGSAAAGQPTRTMEIPLANGSGVLVEYEGKVAPRVRVVPAEDASLSLPAWQVPGHAELDRLFALMSRRHSELMRRMDMLARHQGAGLPAINLASVGQAPAGTSSVSVVTVSNAGTTCTRTTNVVSQGAGQPPRVTSRVSGDCGPREDMDAAPAAVSQT